MGHATAALRGRQAHFSITIAGTRSFISVAIGIAVFYGVANGRDDVIIGSNLERQEFWGRSLITKFGVRPDSKKGSAVRRNEIGEPLTDSPRIGAGALTQQAIEAGRKHFWANTPGSRICMVDEWLFAGTGTRELPFQGLEALP